MNIDNLLKTGHPIQLVINATDLKEAFLAWEQNHSKEDWLPTSEVVNKYSITKRTLKNYEKRGLLNPVRRGVEMHYRLSELSKVFGE